MFRNICDIFLIENIYYIDYQTFKIFSFVNKKIKNQITQITFSTCNIKAPNLLLIYTLKSNYIYYINYTPIYNPEIL